jgi:phenylacetate-CoA ligase
LTRNENRPYWNMEVEPKLGSPEIRKLQLTRLKAQVKYVYEHSGFHRQRFDEAGVKPEDIKSFEEFSQRVPLFTKEDWRASQEESLEKHGHALGMHLCVPREEIRLLASTTGTTGIPTFYLFTEQDLKDYCETRSRTFWRVGLRPGMTFLHAFALGMFTGGIPMIIGARHFGLNVVPVGAEAGSAKVLTFAKFTRPHAMCLTPSFAEYLIEKAPETIGMEIKELGIRILIMGGEPGAGIPEVRARLEQAYGAKVFDIQGPTPSCDHPEYQGMHRISDDFELRELVDPETKEPVTFEQGAKGESVMTQLTNRAAPFIRYTSGDIHQVFTQPCPCGKSGTRFKILGRTDDMLKVKGVLVYPSAVKDVVTSFVPKVTGHFRIILDEPPPRVKPPLTLKVEKGKGVKGDALKELEKKMLDEMHSKLRIRPEITWLEPDSLERASHKTKIIEKTYK